MEPIRKKFFRNEKIIRTEEVLPYALYGRTSSACITFALRMKFFHMNPMEELLPYVQISQEKLLP